MNRRTAVGLAVVAVVVYLTVLALVLAGIWTNTATRDLSTLLFYTATAVVLAAVFGGMFIALGVSLWDEVQPRRKPRPTASAALSHSAKAAVDDAARRYGGVIRG